MAASSAIVCRGQPQALDSVLATTRRRSLLLQLQARGWLSWLCPRALIVLPPASPRCWGKGSSVLNFVVVFWQLDTWKGRLGSCEGIDDGVLQPHLNGSGHGLDQPAEELDQPAVLMPCGSTPGQGGDVPVTTLAAAPNLCSGLRTVCVPSVLPSPPRTNSWSCTAEPRSAQAPCGT